ncbi:MAG TPA: SDR family oxidoreductase [Pyrinomonadaceae bacterium]|nr:SDR family oxidoreductase [Pyrinomonadaceae bacterium]
MFDRKVDANRDSPQNLRAMSETDPKAAKAAKSDRYSLVTGASTGLGRTFAKSLAARKHNLVVIARSEDKLVELAKQLREQHGIAVEVIPIDLSAAGAGLQVIQELTRRQLQIDLLVNNAGFGLQGAFVQLDLARQLEMIQLHNSVVVELCHRLLPDMIKARRGGIINVSSMAGMQAAPYATVYSASKAFLTTFSLALEREVKKHGVRIVTVCPGRLEPGPEKEADTNRQKFPGGEQSQEEVVSEALRMLDKGGGLLIPGVVNKFANVAQRFFPRRLVAKGISKMSPFRK